MAGNSAEGKCQPHLQPDCHNGGVHVKLLVESGELWLQELDAVKDVLRGERTRAAKALRDQQFRLAAYTTVIMRMLGDEVPRTVRLQLLRKVCCFLPALALAHTCPKADCQLNELHWSSASCPKTAALAASWPVSQYAVESIHCSVSAVATS